MSSPKEASGQQAPVAPRVEQSAGVGAESISAVPATGGRQSFRNIRRQLTEEELTAPGVQKLLLDELEGAEAEREASQTYVSRFHEADKRAAILEERSRLSTATEVMFAVMLAVGSGIMGLGASLWDKGGAGILVVVLGGLLVGGAIVARVVKQ